MSYDSCYKDRDAYNNCKHCYNLPENVFEECRQGAEEAGFFKQAFQHNMTMADAKDYKLRDISGNLENLKLLIWEVEKEIALLPTSSQKDSLQKSILTTHQFWTEYKKELGITDKSTPDMPVKWAHERYTAIVGSAVALNGQVSKMLVDNARMMVKKKSSLKSKLFSSSKVKALKANLENIEAIQKTIAGLPNGSDPKIFETRLKQTKALVQAYKDLQKRANS